MKKLIVIFSLLTLSVFAEDRLIQVSGREREWDTKKPVFWYVVDTFNVTVTNTYYTTNGTPYNITNYAHTAENTNNALFSVNFYYKDGKENAWKYTCWESKAGGFDITTKYLALEDYCHNNKKMDCTIGLTLKEHDLLNGLTDSTNSWNDIKSTLPFVDDSKKVNERKKEYKESKK